MPTESPSRLLRSAHETTPNGSTVVSELALRPGFSPQARMPPTAHRASRGARRGLLVLTAGPLVLWALPHRPGGLVPIRLNARGFSPSSLRAVPTEGWEGVKTMTRTEHHHAARRRGELARDRGSRRVSSAIDAQRRLNPRPARGTPTKADSVGPSDPRSGYPTRTYD
jgi:hypothetical protein